MSAKDSPAKKTYPRINISDRNKIISDYLQSGIVPEGYRVVETRTKNKYQVRSTTVNKELIQRKIDKLQLKIDELKALIS